MPWPTAAPPRAGPRCRRSGSRPCACPPRPRARQAAARPSAPVGSTTSFIRSHRKRMARTISSSETVTMSSTYCADERERELRPATACARRRRWCAGCAPSAACPCGTSAWRRRPPPAPRRSRGSPARAAAPRSRSPRAARRRRRARAAGRARPTSSISSQRGRALAGDHVRDGRRAGSGRRSPSAWSRRAISSRSSRRRVVGHHPRAVAFGRAAAWRRARPSASRWSPSSPSSRLARATACAWLPDEYARTPARALASAQLRRSRCRRRGT